MVNKMIVLGNIGKDLKEKATKSGTLGRKFGVAVSEKYKEEKKTTWFNCVAYGKTAEILEKLWPRIKTIYVEGKMIMVPYETEDGKKHTYPEVLVQNFSIADWKEDGQPTLAFKAPGADNQKKVLSEQDLAFKKIADEIPF